ncbi:hypothetical protein V6N13_076176 [Hibiscus sabdariffa]
MVSVHGKRCSVRELMVCGVVESNGSYEYRFDDDVVDGWIGVRMRGMGCSMGKLGDGERRLMVLILALSLGMNIRVLWSNGEWLLLWWWMCGDRSKEGRYGAGSMDPLMCWKMLKGAVWFSKWDAPCSNQPGTLGAPAGSVQVWDHGV